MHHSVNIIFSSVNIVNSVAYKGVVMLEKVCSVHVHYFHVHAGHTVQLEYSL